jgi:hypothetical protein
METLALSGRAGQAAFQNDGDRFRKAGNGEVRFLAQWLVIAVIDKNGHAPGGMRAINVPPAIADEKAALQVNVMAGGGAKQQPGLRFPAIARFATTRAGVITNLDRIQRGNRSSELFVDGFNDFPGLSSAPNVRLICDYDQKKAGRFQLRTPIGDARIKLELVKTRGRKGTSIAHDGPVQYPIAIEEYRAPFYFVLSHFVGAVFSTG